MKLFLSKWLFVLLAAIVIMAAFFPNGKAQAASVRTGYVDLDAGTLNVRSGPGKTYDIIGALSDQQKVSVTSSPKKAWLAISWRGGTGYVSAEFIRFYTPMSFTKAKEIGQRAVAYQKKISSTHSYTVATIHRKLAPAFTSAYINKLIHYDMDSFEKNRYGEKLYTWRGTDFPYYAIWDFDWSGKEATSKPVITSYMKNNQHYLKIYQHKINDMYNSHQSLYLKLYGDQWKVYHYRW
ncbi:peptidase M23 [Fictibacillus macauensis ZFHKF-1]|uniref:Peptidase M23 n=1 Tax=Fictibacillus macauensis ZFHKF-1 TaxID=1196324 RepID=I8UAP6_9BACL|nr:SH3 domain-containing protein [Fictibacillus macauensis]EIT83985.1 peptidase M23 [Fictibacillus macauensis ZFHKF-1]